MSKLKSGIPCILVRFKHRKRCYCSVLITVATETTTPYVYSLKRRGQIVRLIDTPGFDDTKKSDLQILTDLTYWLTGAYQTKPPLLLSGAVYLHPINEPKLQGTAKKNLSMFKLLCGAEVLHTVVLATTMWDPKMENDGVERQKQLENTKEFWGEMIQQGSKVFRHDNTRESAFKIIDHIIDKRQKVILSIQRQMVDGNMTIDETDAGQVHKAKILEEKEKAERRLKQKQEELDEKLRSAQAEDAEELMREQERHQTQINQKNEEIQALHMSVAQLRKEKEQQMEHEEHQLQELWASQDRKISEMTQELQELQQVQSNDKHSLQAVQSSAYDERTYQMLTSKIGENENYMRMLSEQIDKMNIEKEMSRRQEKQKIAKRSMQFGGLGALFGGLAAGASCSVM